MRNERDWRGLELACSGTDCSALRWIGNGVEGAPRAGGGACQNVRAIWKR
jgi:hypothetical protein